MPQQLKSLYAFAVANIIRRFLTPSRMPARKPDVSPPALLIILFLSVFPLSLQAALSEKTVIESRKFQADDLYQVLLAEISNEFGDKNNAVDYYYKLSVKNSDPAIAKRVTELATVTGQISKALDGAKRWVELSPKNLESNQYLALLYIRNSRFNLAAQQLDTIRSLIESTTVLDEIVANSIDSEGLNNESIEEINTSESMSFIGAMLSAESHHKKALSVFNLYIKNHASKLNGHQSYDKQQRLIGAQLALKAKEYDLVLDLLKDIGELDGGNYVDAQAMQAKALHKLRRNNEAIKYLTSILHHQKANDSHRLELVRLMVIAKKKKEALPILESLVKVHEKNFELLKSLISLQIEQSKLSDVQSNIERLKTNKRYINESHYLAGEFAEKLGQQEKALLNYSLVKKGTYAKNAHKKMIGLTRTMYGDQQLYKLFASRQQQAVKISEQAYWVKLEADAVFESQKFNKALALYDKAIQLSPDKVLYRYQRGLVFERLGNIERAEDDFSLVLKHRKNHVSTLNAFAYMLAVHTKRFDESKVMLKKALTLKPHDPLLMDSFGFLIYKVGEFERSEKYLRKAFSVLQRPQVASHLIAVLVAMNQQGEAKKLYDAMSRAFPQSPSLENISHLLADS